MAGVRVVYIVHQIPEPAVRMLVHLFAGGLPHPSRVVVWPLPVGFEADLDQMRRREDDFQVAVKKWLSEPVDESEDVAT